MQSRPSRQSCFRPLWDSRDMKRTKSAAAELLSASLSSNAALLSVVEKNPGAALKHVRHGKTGHKKKRSFNDIFGL